MLRPTAILDFQIDPSLANEETPLEIRRAYSYVAPMRITDGGTPEPPYEPANTIGLQVKLTNRPYWRSSVEGADSIWSEVVGPWLHNKIVKIQSTVSAYNNCKQEAGTTELHFKFLALDMDGIRIVVENQNDLFPADLESQLARLRELLNTGLLADEEVVQVSMPWQDPTAIQARYDEKVAAEAAVEAAEAAAAPAPAADAEASQAGVADTADVTTADDEAAAADETAAPSIDYTVWEVVRADGSSLLVDSAAGVRYTV
jgi:hypothetical protein